MKPTSTQNPSRPHRFNRLQRLQALLFALILMLSSLGLPVIAEETPEEQAVQEAAAPNVYGVVVVGELEEKQLTADLGGDSQISVLYGKNANIPDGAELRVSPIADASAYEEQAKKDLNVKSVDFVQLFDMGIYYDGVKIEPAEKVKIRFRLTEDMKREGDLRIVHFPTDLVPATQEPEPAPVPAAAPKKLMAVKGAKAAPTAVEPQSEDDDDDLMPVQAASVDMPITEELTPVLEDENMVSFETYSFSVFGVCYTVDFYYGEFEYHLNGEGSMTLSALFAALEIDRSAADAVNVAFSDPELLAVEQTDDGADWILTSLQPFNTTETLTVDFANGDQIVVRVEDAQYAFKVVVNNSSMGNFTSGYFSGSRTEFSMAAGSHSGSNPAETTATGIWRSFEAHPNENYDFVYWLIVYPNNSQEIVYDTTLPNSTQLKDGGTTTIIAFFAPINTYLIRFISPINGNPGFANGTSGHWTEGQLYAYSNESTVVQVTPTNGTSIVDWYNNKTELIQANSPTFAVNSATKDLVLHPICREPNVYTIRYKVELTSNTKLDNDATEKIEYVNENGTIVGATARRTYTNRHFIGWVDSNYNFIRKPNNPDDTSDSALTFVPTGDQIYDGAVYTAFFVPDNCIEVKVNDAALGVVNDDSQWWSTSNNVQVFNGNDRVNVVQLKGKNNGFENHLLFSLTASPLNSTASIFVKWKLDGVDRFYTPTISNTENIQQYFDSSKTVHTLEAVFEPRITVTYDLGVIQQVGNNSAGWQHWVDVPWCSNTIEFANESPWDQTKTDALVSLGNDQYITDITNNTVYVPYLYSSTCYPIPYTNVKRVSQTNNEYNLLTHTFRGWKRSDTGALVEPGTTLTGITESITLTAVWDAYFPGKGQYDAWQWTNGTNTEPTTSDYRPYRFNTNTCGFFVRLFDSTFDKGDNGTYTDCLFTSRIFVTGSGNLAQNNYNGDRLDYYGNSDAYDQTMINQIDAGLRSIHSSGVTYNQYKNANGINDQNYHSLCDNTTITLELDFPSDDFIFSRIRQWNLSAPQSRKIQINGHQIPQDMLTSDYFEIKWYVLKDQENSWHIDGMLIPKYAKLRATKQFIGPMAALDSAKNGYIITVQETSPRTGYSADSHVLTMGYNGSTGAVTWTYTMNGTNISRTSGEDGSTWTFKDASGSLLARVSSDIGGNDISWSLHRLTPMTAYTVTESGYDATGYTAITNYTIENTPQSSGLTGNTATASVERVYNYPDYMSETSYQTVAFTNIYTLPYVMTIMKQDGTTLHGLSNVFFDFVMKDGNNQTVYSEVCHSDANGQISIHFDHGLLGDFTFTLDEQPYDGYQALATVRGNVNINNQGKVTLSDVQTTINGVNTTITPDANDPSIIYLINHPERKRVVVNKIWTNNSDARPVTMQLLRNGVPMSGMYVVLGASEATAQGVTPVKVTGWTYTWNDLPAYVDGTEVIYTAREEWIGEPGGVDSIHYNTGNDSDGYLEYIVNQSQTVTTVTEGENTVTIVNVRVENTRDNGQIMFSKVDTGKKAVNGAVFAVFPDPDPDPGYNRKPPSLDTPCVKKLDETDATYTSVNGVVTIDNLAHPNADNWYWLREISTPAGYEDHSNYWYLLNIKGNNSRMYDYGVNGELFSLSQNVDSVENKPFTANVKVIKTGTNNAALSGAVFSLHRSFLGFMVPAPIRGYEALTTNSSGELAYANGTPIIFTLEEGVYFLKEESAPAGYIPLQNPIKLEIRDTARPDYSNVLTATIQNDPVTLSVTTVGNDQVLTVPNTPGVELPSTGGPGTAAYLAVGLALMALALILTRLRKRVQA